jgi:hypothetical protein
MKDSTKLELTIIEASLARHSEWWADAKEQADAAYIKLRTVVDSISQSDIVPVLAEDFVRKNERKLAAQTLVDCVQTVNLLQSRDRTVVQRYAAAVALIDAYTAYERATLAISDDKDQIAK